MKLTLLFTILLMFLSISDISAASRRKHKKQVPNALHLDDHFGHHPLLSPYGPTPYGPLKPYHILGPHVERVHTVYHAPPQPAVVYQPQFVNSVVAPVPVLSVAPTVTHQYVHEPAISTHHVVSHQVYTPGTEPDSVIVQNSLSYPRVTYGHQITPAMRLAKVKKTLKKRQVRQTFATQVRQVCEVSQSPFFNHCQSLSDCGLCAASPHCGWCGSTNTCLPGTLVGCTCSGACLSLWTFKVEMCPKVTGKFLNVSPEASTLINPEIARPKHHVTTVHNHAHVLSHPVVTGYATQEVGQSQIYDPVTNHRTIVHHTQSKPIVGEVRQVYNTQSYSSKIHYRDSGEEAVAFDGVDPVRTHGIDTARLIRKLAHRFRRQHRQRRY